MHDTPTMRRREYLGAGLGLALGGSGGCLQAVLTDGGDAGEPLRRLSIGDSNAPPDQAPFELEIAVSDRFVTTEATATLESAVRNVGDTPEQHGPAYYKGSSATMGAEGILLYSTRAADSPPPDYVPRCVTGADSGPNRRGFSLEGEPRVQLEPGESLTNTLLVADDPTVEGCVSPDTYRFGDIFFLEEAPETLVTYDEARRRDDAFLWEWTLVVEDISEAEAGEAVRGSHSGNTRS